MPESIANGWSINVSDLLRQAEELSAPAEKHLAVEMLWKAGVLTTDELRYSYDLLY